MHLAVRSAAAEYDGRGERAGPRVDAAVDEFLVDDPPPAALNVLRRVEGAVVERDGAVVRADEARVPPRRVGFDRHPQQRVARLESVQGGAQRGAGDGPVQADPSDDVQR